MTDEEIDDVSLEELNSFLSVTYDLAERGLVLVRQSYLDDLSNQVDNLSDELTSLLANPNGGALALSVLRRMMGPDLDGVDADIRTYGPLAPPGFHGKKYLGLDYSSMDLTPDEADLLKKLKKEWEDD